MIAGGPQEPFDSPMNQHASKNAKTWLSPLSFILKKLIASDESFASAVQTLAGKTILFHVDGLNIHLFASFHVGDITLSHELPSYVETADVSLRGRVKDFIALAKQQRDGQSMSAGQVEIQGDLHTAQAVQNLFKSVDLDLEEVLARATNDSFAYGVGSFVRRAARGVRQGLAALEQDLGEYIQYEKRLTPSASELDDFARAVDELAVDVDRLELRIEQFNKLK